MIKEYLAFLRDNPEGYWFKNKFFSWGWTPVKLQGWLVIFGFVILVAFNFYRIDSHSHSASDTLVNFIPQTIVLAIILIMICWKTGEKPRWHWGIPERYKQANPERKSGKLKFTNLSVFIIFFGVALLEAIQNKNWLEAMLFIALGILSVRVDISGK